MNTYEVCLFGDISIRNEQGELLSGDSMRSPTLVKLLAYFLYYHEKHITTQELIAYLYEDAEIDNPEGALKNLVYRLRQAIRKQWASSDPDADPPELISSSKGAYFINENIKLRLDTTLFSEAIREAQCTEDCEEIIECLEKAVRLYRGSFVKGYEEAYWVTSQSTYYQNQFLQAAKRLCVLLEEKKRYQDVLIIAAKALDKDNYDEYLYCLLIRALLGMHKESEAMEWYTKARRAIHEGLGIWHASELDEIHKLLMKQINEPAAGLQEICDDLSDERAGAYFCEYGIFRAIWQLELRKADRLTDANKPALVLINLHVTCSENLVRKQDLLMHAAETLQALLINELRAGDAISAYSKSQYLVMLANCDETKANLVMDRIEKRFCDIYGKKAIKLMFLIQNRL